MEKKNLFSLDLSLKEAWDILEKATPQCRGIEYYGENFKYTLYNHFLMVYKQKGNGDYEYDWCFRTDLRFFEGNVTVRKAIKSINKKETAF